MFLADGSVEEKMKSLSLFLFTCCDVLELLLAEELYTGT